MAKNYVEDGKTIEIVATTSLKSGDLVQVGDMFAVAVTDIAAGSAEPASQKGYSAYQN